MSEWTPEKLAQIESIIANSEHEYSAGFANWLRLNHSTWKQFAITARRAFELNHQHRFGAQAIIEIIRWETVIAGHDVTFKVNNNIGADLARLTMDCYPDMKGYFKLRERKNTNDLFL